jgi:sulfite exporter TauE/SafE
MEASMVDLVVSALLALSLGSHPPLLEAAILAQQVNIHIHDTGIRLQPGIVLLILG